MTTQAIATQEYNEALESQQSLRQLIASIHESVVQIRQYQLDYEKDIYQLEASLKRVHQQATEERLARTNKFMQQLLQMERDQLRQLNDLNIRLNEAIQFTESKLADYKERT
tara:strand:- start:57 stop:392 length:336 start_codon:yes stop_codon:yes gene_type:complete